jgi:hypothetical protein
VTADGITARDRAEVNLQLAHSLLENGDELPLDFDVVRALAVLAGKPGAWMATSIAVSVLDMQVMPLVVATWFLTATLCRRPSVLCLILCADANA